MTKKYSYEFVKNYFEEQGCELLEREYVNSYTKMKYKCNCGNINSIIWSSFKGGSRCKKCGDVRGGKKSRFTYEYVYNYFKEQNCEMLDLVYVGVNEKIKYRCSCGDISHINFNNFKQGKRCKKCGLKKRRGKNHFNWTEDRDAFKEHKEFRDRCYKMLRNTLKRTRQKKNDRTCKLLGYTFEELQNYIKYHPNWDNVKNSKWHVDHVYPIQAFVEYGIKDIKLINCLDNLQSLERIENISKGGYYNKSEFEEWLIAKGYKI